MIYYGDAGQYVKETPSVFRKILFEKNHIFLPCTELIKDKRPSNIYLVGSGSSYYSAQLAAPFLKKFLGIPVVAVSPINFMEEMEQDLKQALVCGISQQGTSTGVIRAIDYAKKRGCQVLACTGEYNTEIVHHGDAVLYVECGIEDAGASTKGYTATAFTLILFGMHMAKVWGRLSEKTEWQYQEQIEQTIVHMEKNLNLKEEWYEHTAEGLEKCQDLIILGSSKSRRILPEIVLKFSETCRFPVRGYEAEEFMHGVYNAVNYNTEFLYLFDGEKESDERLWKLSEYYQKQGNKQYCINAGIGKGIEKRFVTNGMFSIFEYILPIQMLFIDVSKRRGINLNIPKDPDFHKHMNSKIE